MEPIPIKAVCPQCNERHVDRNETRLHHKHLCEHCGHIWSPHTLHTVGVDWDPRLSYFEIVLAQRYLHLTHAQLVEIAKLPSQRALILGEAPTPRTRPECPMFPYPEKSAGERLLAISGLDAVTYLRAYDRADLMSTTGWSASNAHEAAKRVAARWQGRRIVLCGERVSTAFGYRGPSYVWTTLYDVDCVRIPHPSGRNAILNTAEERNRVRKALQEALA